MENMIYILYICIVVPLALSLPLIHKASRRIMVFIIIGISSALFISEVNGLLLRLMNFDAEYVTTIITPATEEVIKAIPIGICTAYVGYGMSFIRKRKKLFFCGTFALLTMSIIYHGFFNMLVQSESLKYLGFVLPIASYILGAKEPIMRYKNRKKSEKNAISK